MARRRDIPRDEILDAALLLLQTRGCNGFSIRDLGAETGLRPASLHYHFPSKADLLAAVIRRYRGHLNARIAEIEAETDILRTRLERVIALFSPLAEEDRFCVMGVAAADLLTLPPAPAEEARALTANLMGWLTRFFSRAKAERELPAATEPEASAALLLSAIQGSLMLARTTSREMAGRTMYLALLEITHAEKHV
ncbi:MAG TPA: TetR/AcrR family transcriptional regulator [Verrucomicrobiales bacterium]|nr:TetR/AcrR family transcriptional regulator [Verrucomicrobiales bacterium]